MKIFAKKIFISAVFMLLCVAFIQTKSFAVCNTTMVNPLTETSWTCMYPIRLAGVSLTPSSPDAESYISQPICICQTGIYTDIGLVMGFREPARMQDVVKDAWCLAGLGIDMGNSNVWGDGSSEGQGGKHGIEQGYTAETHTYFYNPIFLLELLIDWRCAEHVPIGISDLSEIRPDHRDSTLSLMLYPETILFANPIGTLACVVDAVAAVAGMPLDALFWCAGSWGNIYPLTGTSAQKGAANIEAAANVATKSIARAHRNLLLWGTKGHAALCQMYPQPVWMKSQYKFQPLRPVRSSTCLPMGRTELLWGQNKNPPIPTKSDNFAYLVWRWRDCCAF